MSGANTSTATDPVSLELIRNRLDSIAEEMEIALLNSSHSTIVKEALDASAALFDAGGQQIAQATAAPIHLGMIIPAVERFLEVFPAATMAEGDAYILNDPFEGGTHLPDLVVSVPVIAAGELIGLATAISHHQEIGGRSPGGGSMQATEIFQEGLRVPPMKLYDAGRPNDTLLALVASNVRIPETVLGDLHAQMAACQVGRRGMLGLVERHGADGLRAAMNELVDQAERLTRRAIEAMPDGSYGFADFLDNDGIDLERRIRIEATVTIDGSDFAVDFSGTDAQVSGPINCVPASTLAAVYFVIRAVTDPSISNNAGCYRPITAILPEGSIVNARSPAAVNGRAVVVRRIVDCLFGALAPVLPDRVPAASSGHPLVLAMGGVDPSGSGQYVTAEIGTGGMGARPGKDGIDAVQTDTSNSQNVPVEALEMDFPLRVHHYRLRTDSGGAGTFRGGLGLEKGLEVLRGELRVSHRGERTYTAPWGLHGGRAGATSRSVIQRTDGSRAAVPSKLDFVLRPGDRLDMATTGGGGLGDPLQRDPSQVLEDVHDRKVTSRAAAEHYGVVVQHGAVELERTTTLRAALTTARGLVSWTYDRGPDCEEP